MKILDWMTYLPTSVVSFLFPPKFGTCMSTCGVQESTLHPTLPLRNAGHLQPSATVCTWVFLRPGAPRCALQRTEDSAHLLEALCWQLPEATSSSQLPVSWLLFQHSLLSAWPQLCPQYLSNFLLFSKVHGRSLCQRPAVLSLQLPRSPDGVWLSSSDLLHPSGPVCPTVLSLKSILHPSSL